VRPAQMLPVAPVPNGGQNRAATSVPPRFIENLNEIGAIQEEWSPHARGCAEKRSPTLSVLSCGPRTRGDAPNVTDDEHVDLKGGPRTRGDAPQAQGAWSLCPRGPPHARGVGYAGTKGVPARTDARVASQLRMGATKGRIVYVALATIVAGCGGTDTWWSAKHPQREYPRTVKLASRVFTPHEACESANRVTLGVVHAEGDPDDVIRAIAEEAAAHGGTHYVIDGGKDDVELVTRGAATQVGATTLVRERTHAETTRQIWATVYRCGPGP
jgi:hypothetical protein